MTVNDVKKYISNSYQTKDEVMIEHIINISKAIGIAKFLKTEFLFKKKMIKNELTSLLTIENLIKYFKEEIMTKEEVQNLNIINKKMKVNLEEKERKDKKELKNTKDSSKEITEFKRSSSTKVNIESENSIRSSTNSTSAATEDLGENKG